MKLRDKWIKTQYSIKKWWFYRKIELPKFTITQIISFAVRLSTIASMLLVYFTLREMQIERDNAYKPYLVIDNCSVTEELDEPLENSENFFTHIDSVSTKIVNIGVGTSKRIYVEHQLITDTLSNLYEHENQNFLSAALSRYKRYKENGKGLGNYSIIYDSYLLSEQEKDVTFLTWALFLNEIDWDKREDLVEAIMEDPYFYQGFLFDLAVCYEDAQGKEYVQHVCMKLMLSIKKDEKNRITGYTYFLDFVDLN